jgi:phenylacetate-CoA oxygenase PaaI subunit
VSARAPAARDAGDAPVESLDALPAVARRAARDLVLCLADSKRILGLRYSDWILGAPELEAGIAASSMAQDEWGHARILYALLQEFGDDPDAIEHTRAPSAYASAEPLDTPLETWPDVVAANLLVDTALTVQLEAIADGRVAVLASRVRKQIEEERFHFAHAAGWARRLAAAGPRARRELGAALRRMWLPVLRWFGRAGSPATAALVGAGVVAGGPDELRARFLDRVGPLVHEARARLVRRARGRWTPATRIAWPRTWDDARRRGNPDGPDADVIARARGDRNRIFLMD